MCRISLLPIVAVLWAALGQAQVETNFEIYAPEVIPGSDPLVPDFNDGSYWTIDLIIRVYANDDWLGTDATAELSGGFFFEHPLGEDVAPDPDLFGEYPALEWDSYYATTSGAPARFVDSETVNERTYKKAVWFDTEDGGAGVFMIARYTARQTCPDTFAIWVQGTHSLVHYGELFEFAGPGLTPPPAAWDLNGDYCVDQADLGILLAAYGGTSDDPDWDCRADIDADYDVDQSDLGILLANWGEGEGCE